MPTRRACLPLLFGLVLLAGFACDEATSDPAATTRPAAAPAGEPAAVDAVEPTPTQAVEVAEPAEPSVPAGGPSCDQRELVGKPGGEARHKCIDYTGHKGEIEPRCFEGTELSEGPCPSEAVIATCTLEATGVTMLYYEGADPARARRDCETIAARFETRPETKPAQ
jgi:hypothetical protein